MVVGGGGVADTVVQQLQFIACLTEWEGADWKARVKLVFTTHDVIKYFLIENIYFLSPGLVCPRLVIIRAIIIFLSRLRALCCYINNVIKIKHNNINDVILSSAAFRQKK